MYVVRVKVIKRKIDFISIQYTPNIIFMICISVCYIFQFTDMIMEIFGQKKNILILILWEKKKVKVIILMWLGIRYYILK